MFYFETIEMVGELSFPHTYQRPANALQNTLSLLVRGIFFVGSFDSL